jgi:hypothetical protein
VGIIRGESDDEMKELRTAEEVAKRFVAWDVRVSGMADFQNDFATLLGYVL